MDWSKLFKKKDIGEFLMRRKLIKAITCFIPNKTTRHKAQSFLTSLLTKENVSFVTAPDAPWALVSYLIDWALEPKKKNLFQYHSNRWENKELVHSLMKLGYNVDVIFYKNHFFKPKKDYRVIIDLGTHFNFWNLPSTCFKIQYLTGSDAHYQNQKEQQRCESLNHRRKAHCRPKRFLEDAQKLRVSLEKADAAILLGNKHTLSTYPPELHSKIHLLDLTGSDLTYTAKQKDFIPPPSDRGILWIGGAGVILKGLDLLLEVFSKHPEWHLHIAGKIQSERDFVEVYQKELFETKNIHCYGLVQPNSDLFKQILSKCVAFVNASGSEATSTAAITALNAGLYPIISRDTGIDLPKGKGIYLETCSIPEIEETLKSFFEKDMTQVENDIRFLQSYFTKRYSRDNFSKNSFALLKKLLH